MGRRDDGGGAGAGVRALEPFGARLGARFCLAPGVLSLPARSGIRGAARPGEGPAAPVVASPAGVFSQSPPCRRC